MPLRQIRMIRGPYKGRVHDVEPYSSGECAKLRPEEATTLLKAGWAEVVRGPEPERAVAAPAVERAVKPAAKKVAKKPRKRPVKKK